MSLSGEGPRELAEEVRRHVQQLRASAPDLTDTQAFRDALLITARNRGLRVGDIEAQLAHWAKETAAKAGGDHYECALAAWAEGDMTRAAEKARQAALFSAAAARCAEVTDQESSDQYFDGSGSGAGRARDARTAAGRAAIEECRAWLLLSHIQYSSGQLREALQTGRKAMAASVSEREPMLWAEAASQVAWILDEVGEHADAESLLRSVLRVLEQTKGQFAPEVAAALNNLGGLLRDTGRLEEAEMLYRRSLTLTERVFGEKHSQVAICLNNLAGLLRSHARQAEAEPLIRRALEIDEAHYGDAHPSVALYLNNLASMLYGLGRCEEALVYFQRALEIDERLFGEDHPSVSSDLENLAILLRAMKRHADAEPLLRRSLELAERRHGPHHHSVAAELTHLSMLLSEMDRGREAGDLSRRAVKVALSYAARTGRPAPGTRLVGQAYCQVLRRLGIPEDEMQSMLFMMKREVEQESPAVPSTAWLEVVMDEMGISHERGDAATASATQLN